MEMDELERNNILESFFKTRSKEYQKEWTGMASLFNHMSLEELKREVLKAMKVKYLALKADRHEIEKAQSKEEIAKILQNE